MRVAVHQHYLSFKRLRFGGECVQKISVAIDAWKRFAFVDGFSFRPVKTWIGLKISTANGIPYFSFLGIAYVPAGNTCDLVAYFLRRGFALLRRGGGLGLIATNSIAQGDTRSGGLAEIRRRGGRIYAATRRYPWPGQAGVIVSLVHISNEERPGPAELDGKQVPAVSAFLFPGTQDSTPIRLTANSGHFSLGSYIYGAGFLFDDSDPDASPVSSPGGHPKSPTCGHPKLLHLS